MGLLDPVCVLVPASLPETDPVNHKSRGESTSANDRNCECVRLRHYTSTPVVGRVVLGFPVDDEAIITDSVSDVAGASGTSIGE
jgi:hypothetical protein